MIGLGVLRARRLLTLAGLAEHEPVAVVPSGVVRDFPLGVYDRTFPDLHDAVTRLESDLPCRLDQVHVSPLILVVMNIVSNLAQQNAFGPQNPIGFFEKRRIRVRERVAMFLRRPLAKPEARVEILQSIPPLVRDMWRIVDDHVHNPAPEGHVHVVTDHRRPVATLHIEADHSPLTPSPEAPYVYRGVQDSFGASFRVEPQQAL